MMIKTLAGIALFALAGGAIGYSQILCANGECAITGTPYGGALFGGVLGLAVMSSLGGGLPAGLPEDAEQQDDSEDKKDESA
ncbi:MAG: hypothetical protein KTR15_14035 [Phycisphaeraceae bacterium]|nr:hypothetical protein [Phycisphaeraceae bacterium]